MSHLKRQRAAAVAPRPRASDRPVPSTHVDVAHAQPALVALVRDETREFGPTVMALGLTSRSSHSKSLVATPDLQAKQAPHRFEMFSHR